MHPLDNPIWQALTTTQASFAEARGGARRFRRDVSVLAGFSDPTPENYDSLATLLSPDEPVGLFLQGAPYAPAPWVVVKTIPVVQMLCENPRSSRPEPHATGERSNQKFLRLTDADVTEMLALTRLTKPGPFSARTLEMGSYLGTRRGGTLAAMAGERLRLPGYTEISAVCTHPDHLGHGYASALIAVLMDRIDSRNELPFLHVRPENLRAIQVYERLGFARRALLQYAVLRHQKE